MDTLRITQNGIFPLKRTKFGGNNDKLILLASGEYGGATLHLQVLNGAGNWVPVEGGAILLNSQEVLHIGTSLKFAVACTISSGTTNIVLDTEETG